MSRSWWENEELLRRFRDWLTGATEEAAALWAEGEPASSDPDTAADESSPSLQAFEQGHWSSQPTENESAGLGFSIHEKQAIPTRVEANPGRRRHDARVEEPLPDTGLRQLVEAFTALRQENKLQTKSARGLEEAMKSALGGLDGAVRQLLTIQSREQEAADREALPLVQALAALHESLLRVHDSFQRTGGETAARLEEALRETVEERARAWPAWKRWLLGSELDTFVASTLELTDVAFDEESQAMAQGLEMTVRRAARLLAAVDIERIETLGLPVDPARMMVVALVHDAEQPPETVMEEVRPGYEWRGRVIQFAEVKSTPAARRETASRELGGDPFVEDDDDGPDDCLPDARTVPQNDEHVNE